MVSLGYNAAKATANRHLGAYTKRVNQSVTKLASGTRHRGVIDGSVDISLAAKWSAKEGRERATRDNLGNALSYTHTQDAFLAKAGKILDRMSELAIKAMDTTTGSGGKTFEQIRAGAMTWQQAKDDAEARGGRLAIIRDAADYSDLQSKATNNVWVGATDVEQDGVWKWLDGTSVTAGAFAAPISSPSQYLLYSTTTPGWHPNLGASTANGYLIEYTNESAYEAEFAQLAEQLSSLQSKQLNGRALLDGTALNVATSDGSATLTLGGVDISDSAFTDINNSANSNGDYFYSQPAAQTVLTEITEAIDKLAEFRATVGANAASIEREMASSAIHADQLSSAKSKVHDANISEESSIMARNQVLVASASSMVAQGDILPQMALRLLG